MAKTLLGWKDDVISGWFQGRVTYESCFDGRMFGGKSAQGELIKQPWKVVTSWQELTTELENHRCNHSRDTHDLCQGRNTQLTERCTPQLAELVVNTLIAGNGRRDQISGNPSILKAGGNSGPVLAIAPAQAAQSKDTGKGMWQFMKNVYHNDDQSSVLNKSAEGN